MYRTVCQLFYAILLREQRLGEVASPECLTVPAVKSSLTVGKVTTSANGFVRALSTLGIAV
jgi:hypothetical protein